MKAAKEKKWICGVCAFATCFILMGCGHEHTWIDASCSEPETCSECGETEGEALGHTWVDATCLEPRHCSVCGETEGQALEHTLTEATYQQPATCKVCGTTVGEVLTPAFEEYGVKGQFMELGKTYDYVTCCNKEKGYEDYKTVAQATVTDYQTFSSDDTHEAKEGYEWKIVEMQLVFSDDNARSYGTAYELCFENYYDIIGLDNSFVLDDNGKGTFTVNFNGQDYTECIMQESDVKSGWKGETDTFTFTYEYLLPIDYDGAVIGSYDASIPWEEGQHIFDVANDDTLFFRLN